jgi:hypothetical protein
MKTTRLRARADAGGVVHLHLPIAHPNAEVELEVAITRVEGMTESGPSNLCDRRIFASLLGDRSYSRRKYHTRNIDPTEHAVL